MFKAEKLCMADTVDFLGNIVLIVNGDCFSVSVRPLENGLNKLCNLHGGFFLSIFSVDHAAKGHDGKPYGEGHEWFIDEWNPVNDFP